MKRTEIAAEMWRSGTPCIDISCDSLIHLHPFARLHVVSYLSVSEALRLATTCKEMRPLVEEHFESTPSLVSFNSSDEFVKRGMEKLSAPPSFGLVFYNRERKYEKDIADCPIMNVADLPIAAVRSPQIQSIMGEDISSSTDLSAFVGCFPSPALCVPFCVENDDTSIAFRHTGYRVYPKDEDKRDPKKPDGPEVILMFVCGRPKYPVDKYCKEIHQLYPGVTIIGGVCAGGHVTDRYWEEEGNPKIKKITNGIFGLAMRGVPLRCVVSRGVESIMPSHGSRAEILDFEYDPEEDCIVLHKLKFNGTVMRPSTYAQLMLRELENQNVSSGPLYIGMKLNGESGHRLHNFGRGTIAFHRGGECFLQNTHGVKGKPSKKNGVYGAIEMYHITSDSTIKDLDRTMARLRNEVEAAGEEIVGSIMASCNARGPSSGQNVPCRMMDATRFAKAFPDVPLIGFYAGGEIGPAALADMDSGVYRTGDTQFQGFTVVFGLLAVPKRDKNMMKSIYNS